MPNAISGKAEIPAGVRIAFESDTTTIKIGIVPVEAELDFGVFIDGKQFQHVKLPVGGINFVIESLLTKYKHMDIYLSQKHSVQLTGVWIDDRAQWSPVLNQQKSGSHMGVRLHNVWLQKVPQIHGPLSYLETQFRSNMFGV